jgi:ABC-type cobalamin transport system permease subunit
MGYLSRPINLVVVGAAAALLGAGVTFTIGKLLAEPGFVTVSAWLLGCGVTIASLPLLGFLGIAAWDRLTRNR